MSNITKIMPKLLDHIREEMDWNMGDPENDCKLPTQDAFDSWNDGFPEDATIENTISYGCYPGSPIVTEMREAIKEFNPKLKAVTLVKELYGDRHLYYFMIKYRVGQELDEEETDDADYQEALFKMDKFMSDEPEAMNEYEEINSVAEMIEYLELHMVDEDRFHDYAGGGTIQGFAEYLTKEKNK